jgi:TatD DNase family protein
MSVVDCHSHLSFLNLDEATEFIQGADADKQWIMGGYQPSEWEHQVALKNQFPERIKTCFGLHPWFIKSKEFELSRDLEELKIWADQADFIGEVGLDFFGDEATLKKEAQINVFERQLEIAHNKPFVFHIVQAHGKALEILKDYSVKGFVHSFSGSVEVAEQYMANSILISFGPNILNDNFKKAREALEKLPKEAILFESDTPSNAIDDGNPNKVFEEVLNKAAEIRSTTVEELLACHRKNLATLTDS